MSSRRRGSARLRFAHPPRWAGSGVVPAGALRAASDAFGTRRRDARVARRVVRPVYDRARATRWNPTRRRGRAVGVSDRDDHHRRGMELENPAARARRDRARARVPSARDAPRNTPVAFTGTTTHLASRLMRDASVSSSRARSSSARIPPRLLGFFPPAGPQLCPKSSFSLADHVLRSIQPLTNRGSISRPAGATRRSRAPRPSPRTCTSSSSSSCTGSSSAARIPKRTRPS